MTDYGAVAHNALPPNDIDEAAFLSGSYVCEAPGCGQPPDAGVHRAAAFHKAAIEAGIAVPAESVDPRFGDLD